VAGPSAKTFGADDKIIMRPFYQTGGEPLGIRELKNTNGVGADMVNDSFHGG